MGRHDLDPEDRDTVPLQLDQIVECPYCHTEFDHIFTAPDGVFEAEDIVDPIEEKVRCPGCGQNVFVRYDGWLHHEDAG